MTARQLVTRTFIAAFAVVLTALPASAQDAAVTQAVAVAPAPQPDSVSGAVAVGPTRSTAAIAVRTSTEPTRTLPAPAAGRNMFTHGEALMLFGGAAILTGIVVGGDAGHAISIGGAVVGLIGLYQYLQ